VFGFGRAIGEHGEGGSKPDESFGKLVVICRLFLVVRLVVEAVKSLRKPLRKAVARAL
jgi:hypothetical protein